MTRSTSALALALAAAAIAAMAGPAQAALLDADAAGSTRAFAGTGDTVAAWLEATSPAAAGGRAYALAAVTPVVPDRLSATALAIGSQTLPTAGTLSVWTFITSMRAQQQADRFVVLEANTSLLQLAEGPAAPVPLPGAVWLLLTGLLGLAGVRGIRSAGSAVIPAGVVPQAGSGMGAGGA